MSSYLRPCTPPPPRFSPYRSTPTTSLYASNGQGVPFARLPADRLLRHSAVAACLSWDGPHRPMALSPPAMRWLSQAQTWAQLHGILLTPPSGLAMELHQFAEAYLVPRVARAAQRSLADALCAETFASTWQLALRQEITQTTFDLRCMNWALERHAALVAANVFLRLEEDAQEAFGAWVAAALTRMSSAEPNDWRRYETAFVWVLRAAQRLDVPYPDVALPDAAQVARDDLQVYRQWVLEHPIWESVPEITHRWAGERVRSRDDYLWHLLREGVSHDSLEPLVALLRVQGSEVDARLYKLLPTYAQRGDIAALGWLMARLPAGMSHKEAVHCDACVAALRADRADALRSILGALSDAERGALLAASAFNLAVCAARWSSEGTAIILAAVQKGGHSHVLDKTKLVEAAVQSGQLKTVQSSLALFDAAARRAQLASCAADAPIPCALRCGDATMVQWLLAQVENPATVCDLLLRHLARVCPPANTPPLAEAALRSRLAILLEALPLLRDIDMNALVSPLMAPLARIAAQLGDYGAAEALLRMRSDLPWRRCCIDILVPAWIHHGAGLTRLRAILAHLPHTEITPWLRANDVALARKAVAGGDVAILQWLVGTIAPNLDARRELYRQAINGGASLVNAAALGHVEMVRFWLKSHAAGAFGPAAVAYANHAIIEKAAQANQPAILDMALAHIPDSAALDALMEEVGANTIAFAMQRGHRNMVRKLLALPLHERTRWAILAHEENSPMYWAERRGVPFMRALLDWAPPNYRQMIQDSGMSEAVIKACTYGSMDVARFALTQGGIQAKRRMLAVHQGGIVVLAAERGDAILLEHAMRLNPPGLSATQRVQGPRPPT